MKNYKVKAIKNFTDKVEKKERIAGKSEFLCTKERYEFLKTNRAVELIEIIEEEKEEEIVEPEEEIIEEPTKDKLVEEIITKKKKTSKK